MAPLKIVAPIVNKTVNTDSAPSLAQADAILAQFGYVDREVASVA